MFAIQIDGMMLAFDVDKIPRLHLMNAADLTKRGAGSRQVMAFALLALGTESLASVAARLPSLGYDLGRLGRPPRPMPLRAARAPSMATRPAVAPRATGRASCPRHSRKPLRHDRPRHVTPLDEVPHGVRDGFRRHSDRRVLRD